MGAGSPPGMSTDLGDVAVLPGLVNAHTHLEFSDLESPLGTRGMSLADWIGQVVRSRHDRSSEQRQGACQMGIVESKRAGVRLIGEISTPPLDYPSIDAGSPVLICFAEVLGLAADRSVERMSAAELHVGKDPTRGWSPHAPYSTARDMIERSVARASEEARPVAMHVAESPDERTLLESATGPLADALRSMGVWENNRFPWPGDPLIDLIDLLSTPPRALLIHGNDLQAAEIERIARYRSITVVYCPRTHDFFGYDEHPVAALLRAGIRVALGTDSRASNPDLNLWREVQYLLRHRQDLRPEQVLRMATRDGADSLGRGELGRIEPAASAALGVVSTASSSTDALYQDLATNDYRPLAIDRDVRS